MYKAYYTSTQEIIYLNAELDEICSGSKRILVLVNRV